VRVRDDDEERARVDAEIAAANLDAVIAAYGRPPPEYVADHWRHARRVAAFAELQTERA
jgi:hypothetical protein